MGFFTNNIKNILGLYHSYFPSSKIPNKVREQPYSSLVHIYLVVFYPNERTSFYAMTTGYMDR